MCQTWYVGRGCKANVLDLVCGEGAIKPWYVKDANVPDLDVGEVCAIKANVMYTRSGLCSYSTGIVSM